MRRRIIALVAIVGVTALLLWFLADDEYFQHVRED
jgi:hypothetical protein